MRTRCCCVRIARSRYSRKRPIRRRKFPPPIGRRTAEATTRASAYQAQSFLSDPADLSQVRTLFLALYQYYILIESNIYEIFATRACEGRLRFREAAEVPFGGARVTTI